MDLTFSGKETAFRNELRAWLAANPPSARPSHGAGGDAVYAWRREWQRQLSDGGWAAPAWPAEYGGRGATLTESAIYFEELGAARVPFPANVLGLLLGGPTLMVWGSEEQKERYLPPILSAEEIWCQGFSEPDAGSDLASLTTRAVKDGDGWVVTGQKVWTSGAQYAKWCMLVARTQPGLAKKHHGLTYFLMDMEQEGVQVRPLRQLTGEAEFNELFIDEARIPDENVIGGVGSGWRVALTTLMNERAGLGFALQVRLRQLLDELFAAAAERGLLGDSLYADALAELHIQTETLRLLAWKGLTDVERYGQPGPEGSLVKWLWSSTNQRLTELAVDMIGPDALTADSSWSYELLRARGNTIEGGTTEILKNIVPERVRENADAATTDTKLWREIAQLGWPGIAVGEEHGGQGLGPVELSILCEELGRVVAPIPFLPTVLAATLIEHAGSGGQRARWLPGLGRGELRGAAGAAGVIPGAAGADVVVVIDDGVARIVTEAGEPVATIDPTRPAARVTDAPGEELTGNLEAALDRASVAVSAELVGVCDRALGMTVDYVKNRRQFGSPVGAFQAVSHRAAEMLLATEVARAAVAHASWAADADPLGLGEAASIAKAAASDAGREVTGAAIQLHGGVGFTWEADVHWLYKRAQLDSQLLGDARHHRARLASLVGARLSGDTQVAGY